MEPVAHDDEAVRAPEHSGPHRPAVRSGERAPHRGCITAGFSNTDRRKTASEVVSTPGLTGQRRGPTARNPAARDCRACRTQAGPMRTPVRAPAATHGEHPGPPGPIARRGACPNPLQRSRLPVSAAEKKPGISTIRFARSSRIQALQQTRTPERQDEPHRRTMRREPTSPTSTTTDSPAGSTTHPRHDPRRTHTPGPSTSTPATPTRKSPEQPHLPTPNTKNLETAATADRAV